MADYVSLTCPSCGGSLQITPDIERFACAHCGREHVVRRAPGVVSLAPVVGAIDRVRAGVDRAASELAIPRIQREISELEAHRRQIVSQHRVEVSMIAIGSLTFAVIFAGLFPFHRSGELLLLGLLMAIIGTLSIADYKKKSKRKSHDMKERLLPIDRNLERMRESLADARRNVDGGK